MDPSAAQPVNLVYPRGLGDYCVAVRIAAGLARRGGQVGLRSKGDVQWAEEGLPVPPGVGRPSDGAEEIDLCDPPRMMGWDYCAPGNLMARIADRIDLPRELLPDNPWVRPEPWPAARYGEYLVVAPIGSTKFSGLAPAQIEAAAMACTAEHGLRCVVVHGTPIPSLPEECEDLTGQTSITELGQIIGSARAVLTVGTGPLHLAGACRVPLLAILGDLMRAEVVVDDYHPALFVQIPGRASYMPAPQLCDLLGLLLRSTVQPVADLDLRAANAAYQQRQIDREASKWKRANCATPAVTVTGAGIKKAAARSKSGRAKRLQSAPRPQPTS